MFGEYVDKLKKENKRLKREVKELKATVKVYNDMMLRLCEWYCSFSDIMLDFSNSMSKQLKNKTWKEM